MERYMVATTYYLWLKDHHTGQWSREYARMCKISRYLTLRGRMQEVATCGDALIIEGYNTLCDRAGCTHGREAVPQ